MDTQLAVIGAGPGGYAAAFLAADLGMEVTLIDARAQLGGVCLQQGCIPSKALLHVAKTMADARHLADWGVSYGEPTIDLDAVRGKKQKLITMLTSGLGQLAKRRKVKVVQAWATFQDSSTLHLKSTGDGSPKGGSLEDNCLRFQHCILATGSSPTLIPALDLPTPRVMDSTAALALADVPETLLVVGGGYIGLELGTVYNALGSRVSVVEMTAGLLPGTDRDLVKPLAKRLEAQFEAVYLGTKVVAMTDRQDAVEVTFEGPSVAAGEEVKRFERVLVAVGRSPNSPGLGLENTSVRIDPQGFVTVDESQRTADAKIMAIGDVAGEPMLAHKASHQGKVAVEVLAGEAAVFEPAAIPAVVFTDPEIAWAGLTEEQAKDQGRRIEVAKFPWAASGRAQAIGRTEGLTKWLIDPENDQLLGCGIVGPGAGDLISEAVLAIESGATVEDITAAIHPHPTLSETLAGAGEVHLGLATDLYRPKRKH